MKLFTAKRRGSTRSRDSRKKSKTRRNWVKYVDLALVFVLVAVMGYLGTLVFQVQSGYAKVQESKTEAIRLQVVNGSGERGLGTDVAGALKRTHWNDLSVEVVDTTWFELHDIETSFVVCRTGDAGPAKLLALRLGLDHERVLCQPLEADKKYITATLVVGQDFIGRDLTAGLEKEMSDSP